MLQVLVNVSLEKFQLQKKRGMGYAKVVQVKNDEKMDKCPKYLKQWVLGCLPEKKRDE